LMKMMNYCIVTLDVKQFLSKQLQSHKNATRSNRSTIARSDYKTHSLNELQDKLQDLCVYNSRVFQS